MDFYDGKYNDNHAYMFCSLVVEMAACICTHSMVELTSAHIHLVHTHASCKFSVLR